MVEELYKSSGNKGVYKQLLKEREVLKSVETAEIQKKLAIFKTTGMA